MARNSKVGKSQHKVHPFFPSYFWKYLPILDKKNRSYSRWPKNVLLALVFFIFCLSLLFCENNRLRQQVLGLQTQIIEQQKLIYEWEIILKEKPDYRDGWLQLAGVWAELGNKEKAQEALARAKAIDPNNKLIPSLEKLLK